MFLRHFLSTGEPPQHQTWSSKLNRHSPDFMNRKHLCKKGNLNSQWKSSDIFNITIWIPHSQNFSFTTILKIIIYLLQIKCNFEVKNSFLMRVETDSLTLTKLLFPDLFGRRCIRRSVKKIEFLVKIWTECNTIFWSLTEIDRGSL